MMQPRDQCGGSRSCRDEGEWASAALNFASQRRSDVKILTLFVFESSPLREVSPLFVDQLVPSVFSPRSEWDLSPRL
jgi:hypothetical protein